MMPTRRPGLKTFLEETCKLYEFHIYTMGTRNYANKVSKMIDPEGSIFIDRVLSRDESGSTSMIVGSLCLTGKGMTQKTIRRLFPCDDSMVVALDDRADVWQWSQNLIKVRPCMWLKRRLCGRSYILSNSPRAHTFSPTLSHSLPFSWRSYSLPLIHANALHRRPG